MSTFKQKISISAGSGLLFFIVNLPFTYKLFSLSTTYNILIQTIIFFIATYLTMGYSENVPIKVGRTLIASVLFLLLSTPFINKLLNNNLLIRTAVYIAILTLMMYS